MSKLIKIIHEDFINGNYTSVDINHFENKLKLERNNLSKLRLLNIIINFKRLYVLKKHCE